MKKLIILLCCITMMSSLVGCTKKTDPVDNSYVENDDVDLEEETLEEETLEEDKVSEDAETPAEGNQYQVASGAQKPD